MTDDRAGGEEMRVWSVAVIAERKWEVGGGGDKTRDERTGEERRSDGMGYNYKI